MRKFLFAVVCFGLMLAPAFAGNSADATWNKTNTDGSVESGWVVSIPSGSSDWFNARYDNVAGRPAYGLSIASADFASGLSYPMTGIYDANFGVDPSGNSPDLSSGLALGAVPGGGSVYNWVYASYGSIQTLGADPQHVACQFPPGDSGSLGVGQDDNAPQTNFSGWTQDAYTTPANGVSGDFGLNINIDVTSEIAGGPTPNNGALSEMLDLTQRTGDFTTVTIGAGDDFGVGAFFGAPGTLWMFFLSFVGLPIKATTGALPSIPDGDGHAFLRGGTSWPLGFGGFTFNFVAVSGRPGVPGTVGVSNEITIITNPDPGCNWGNRDDGSYEGGWVVSIPSGSSDYFNVDYNCLTAPGINNIIDMKVAVMDFGSPFSAYPTTGVFDSNFGVDPSGLTPDLGVGYQVNPFTYPAGTFASTSGLMITRTFTTPINYAATFGTNYDVHSVIQFPPGDSGLLGVGGDTTVTGSNWLNGWTLDGYTTPSNDFSGTAGWGLRLGTN